MKKCCKVGDENPVPSWRKWLKRVVYLVVVAAVVGLLAIEILRG
ncbi:hypothetical protein R9C00_14590 [Flammeovirgaceae bacterium SG7u.111]|nr:hypothetical protein [Flammeovirgaceae bacterium SG7u.132]WPO38686.1 hypothetical protein R9C00_14590 [Flammeovirgaceae bacterium SG7u.111]